MTEQGSPEQEYGASSLTEEEKRRIVERVRFEEEVRQALAPPPAKPARRSVWDFLNSAIGILLLTSLISSGLVPYFQHKQQEAEWKRQLLADEIKYRLTMMRDCLKEFTLSATYTSQAFELFKVVQNRGPLTNADYARYREQLRTLQTNRFPQNARMLSLTVFYPHREEIDKAIDAYTGKATYYIESVERYLELRHQIDAAHLTLAPGDPTRKRLEALEKQAQDLGGVSQAYNECVTKLTNDIDQEEKRYESFSF